MGSWRDTAKWRIDSTASIPRHSKFLGPSLYHHRWLEAFSKRANLRCLGTNHRRTESNSSLCHTSTHNGLYKTGKSTWGCEKNGNLFQHPQSRISARLQPPYWTRSYKLASDALYHNLMSTGWTKSCATNKLVKLKAAKWIPDALLPRTESISLV